MQKVQHGVEKAQALRQGEAAPQKRIIQAENLNHAAGPADALPDVGGERIGCEPRGKRRFRKDGIPAAAVKFQRRVSVFRDGFNGNPAHFFQGAPADDGVGAAEHHGVPGVVSLLDEVVEKAVFVRERPRQMQVFLKGVGRIKVMRRLHEGRPLIL